MSDVAQMKAWVDGKLALLGGEKVLQEEPQSMFKWPIVTEEDEKAVLDVLRAGAMSGTGITQQFEKEYAAWMGVKYALGVCNGTAALLEAFFAVGVDQGDEVICPSMTYWASITPAVATLKATAVFADIDPDTLCLDPKDLERHITPKTKAIVVVHYAGYPADMDEIMAIARKHNVKVIEDVSHAHGTLYKGRLTGTIGDIAAESMMSGKSFATGEAGMVLTNDRNLFERCVAYGHYERNVSSHYAKPSEVLAPELEKYAGVPLGGAKHRMNQTCSAMGRVQLKYYPQRIAEIQKAMNYFWDGLEGVPGIRAHRPAKDSGSTMGGWYAAKGLYRAEELGGLDIERYCEAVRAEGVACCTSGANNPLHLHPFFAEKRAPENLPVSAAIKKIAFTVPWFKHFVPEIIDKYIAAYKKVALHYKDLL